jgi:hypothetical protein
VSADRQLGAGPKRGALVGEVRIRRGSLEHPEQLHNAILTKVREGSGQGVRDDEENRRIVIVNLRQWLRISQAERTKLFDASKSNDSRRAWDTCLQVLLASIKEAYGRAYDDPAVEWR